MGDSNGASDKSVAERLEALLTSGPSVLVGADDVVIQNVVAMQPPGFQQDAECAVALAACLGLVRTVSRAEPGSDDAAEQMLSWAGKAQGLPVSALGMLVTAFRHMANGDGPPPEIALVETLRQWAGELAAVEVTNAAAGDQLRIWICRSRELDLPAVGDLLQRLVSDLAGQCQVKGDAEENLQYWEGLVSSGAAVLAEQHDAWMARNAGSWRPVPHPGALAGGPR
jgi:hypothetical protein